jgi:MFS superfamily sulfate permease-like transporter
VPVSLAYAGLAGLPPRTGLYCFLLAGLGYALFGSSRHLAAGPTSAISLLLGVTLAGQAGGDPARQAAQASVTALIVAGVCVLAWLLRLSVLVSFISESILTVPAPSLDSLDAGTEPIPSPHQAAQAAVKVATRSADHEWLYTS